MTVLVADATHSGAATALAETIVATLTEAGTPAELVDVTIEPDPSAYDAVVLGSGIRIESIEKTAVQWARDHRAALLERPLAFFTCSGSAADPAKRSEERRVGKEGTGSRWQEKWKAVMPQTHES